MLRPKPIISRDEAVSAVDPIVPVQLCEIPRSKGLPPYILLRCRPPPKPPDQLINKPDIGDTKTDIEEDSPSELTDLIDTRNIIQRFFAKANRYR